MTHFPQSVRKQISRDLQVTITEHKWSGWFIPSSFKKIADIVITFRDELESFFDYLLLLTLTLKKNKTTC